MTRCRYRIDRNGRFLTLKLVDRADASSRDPPSNFKYLGVVGSDDQYVVQRDGPLPTIPVDPRSGASQYRLNEIADSLHLFRRTILVPAVIHREIAKSGAADRPRRLDRQSVETGFRSQFSRIEELRSECADVGMHPPGLLEKKPFVGRNGLLLTEDVIQRRHIDAVGMASLRRLVELLRIANQHD